MSEFKVIEVKQSVLENNDRQAEELREELKAEHTFLLNLMSSPGSGKTTTLRRAIEVLKDELRIGIMEADIDSDVDTATIEKTGVKVIQLHTGGALSTPYKNGTVNQFCGWGSAINIDDVRRIVLGDLVLWEAK